MVSRDESQPGSIWLKTCIARDKYILVFEFIANVATHADRLTYIVLGVIKDIAAIRALAAV